jgi:hypothetical protein
MSRATTKVEADELHNNEAPTAALNLGAVFDAVNPTFVSEPIASPFRLRE